MAEYILEMNSITKTFPGVKALDNVNFKVKKGEIHALVGENGAGKSTLMNVLSGIYPYGSYEGDIVYDGEICKFKEIKDSERKGIVIIHQELALVPYMTIAENMFLGNEQGKKFSIDWTTTYGRAEELMKKVGLHEDPHTLVKDIGVGKQQLVEIAKALAKDVKKKGDEAKVAIRNIRRDANEAFKKMNKNNELTEDDQKDLENQAQKMTDKYISDIDKAVEEKTKEIMTV